MTPRPRKTGGKVRAVAYVRVSSDQQVESGLSLEHQERKLRALATVHDYELVSVIVDAGASATTLDRPGMARVLDMVKSRQIEAVMVAKLDRLTRRVKHLSELLELFARKKVALLSAADSINTGTAGGRMVLNVTMSIAEWEVDTIKERTTAALGEKRARGERISRDAPLGFRFVETGTTNRKGRPAFRLEPLNKESIERQQLATIGDCRAAGFTWNAIAQELARLGFKTRSGRPWTLWNVRSAYTTATRHGTISADVG